MGSCLLYSIVRNQVQNTISLTHGNRPIYTILKVNNNVWQQYSIACDEIIVQHYSPSTQTYTHLYLNIMSCQPLLNAATNIHCFTDVLKMKKKEYCVITHSLTHQRTIDYFTSLTKKNHVVRYTYICNSEFLQQQKCILTM